MPYGDFRDEFNETGRSTREMGEYVDPDWPIKRPEFQVSGGPWPEAMKRCTCVCHRDDASYPKDAAEGRHCSFCILYWMPPLSDEAIDSLAATIRRIRNKSSSSEADRH